MKIAVCYKNVPSSDSIQIKSDQTLDFSAASWEIGQYDMNAIEAAVQLASNVGGSEVIAITAAGAMADNSKQKKAVLSRGPDRMIGIKEAALDTADAYAVAKVLAAQLRKLGADLVFFGEGSGDVYAQQTGVLTGALLGWNTLNAVKAVSVEKDQLCVTRSSDNSADRFIVKLPAVLCVTGDINKPRIPTLKDILGAGKKPLELTSPAELGTEVESRVETVSVLAPKQAERRQKIFEACSDEALAEIAQAIRNVK